MKRKFIPLLLFIPLSMLFNCQKAEEQKTTEITLTNQSDIDLSDKAISINKSQLKDIPEGEIFPIITNHEGDTIAAQLDDLDGDENWDELFFVIDLTANGSDHVHLVWSNSSVDFPMKTSVRFGKRDSRESAVYAKTSDTLYADQIHGKLGYQPYQTDGPSWENDKVGFRHYFDGRNAKDLFGKKAPGISPETVGINADGGVEDNYHVMEDWGRDVLSVGNSAGLGGVELMIGEEIVRLGCVAGDSVTNIDHSVFEILNEGSVRSSMRFSYNDWKPTDRTYQLTENVRIWPGMYAFENNVSVSGLQGDESLIVGLVNRDTKEPVSELELNDKYIALYTHDMQTYNSEWWLGLGLILPKDVYDGYGEAPDEGIFSTSYYGKLKIQDGQPVTYYAVGCWELSDTGFTDSLYFVNYLQNLGDQLAAGVDIKID
jgi:hypothetical protein